MGDDFETVRWCLNNGEQYLREYVFTEAGYQKGKEALDRIESRLRKTEAEARRWRRLYGELMGRIERNGDGGGSY